MRYKLTFKTEREADRLEIGNKNEIVEFDGVVLAWDDLTATISTSLGWIDLCKALTKAHIHPVSVSL